MKKLLLKLTVLSLITALLGISCKKGHKDGHLSSNNKILKVTIGNQVWMVKNLNIRTHRNGNPIPRVTDPATWDGLKTGPGSCYNNYPASYTAYHKICN